MHTEEITILNEPLREQTTSALTVWLDGVERFLRVSRRHLLDAMVGVPERVPASDVQKTIEC